MNSVPTRPSKTAIPRKVPRRAEKIAIANRGLDEGAKRGVVGRPSPAGSIGRAGLPIELREDQRAPLFEHLVFSGCATSPLEKTVGQDARRDRITPPQGACLVEKISATNTRK
jgi:hypothetical protein